MGHRNILSVHTGERAGRRSAVSSLKSGFRGSARGQPVRKQDTKTISKGIQLRQMHGIKPPSLEAREEMQGLNLTCYNSDYNRQPPRRYFAPLRHEGSPVGWAIWVQTHRRAYPWRARRDGVCLIRLVESRRRGEVCSGGLGRGPSVRGVVCGAAYRVGGGLQPRRACGRGAVAW